MRFEKRNKTEFAESQVTQYQTVCYDIIIACRAHCERFSEKKQKAMKTQSGFLRIVFSFLIFNFFSRCYAIASC